MEILKRNEEKAPKKFAPRCECGKCNSLLRVNESDLTRFSGSDRDGAWDYEAFQCEACNAWNSMPDGAVPRVVRLRIKQGGLLSVPGGSDCDCKVIPTRSGD